MKPVEKNISAAQMTSVASTMIVLGAYNAMVMTIAENASPRQAGMNSHATDSRMSLPEPESQHQPGAEDAGGEYHDPDHIGGQPRQQARCPVHGQHPQSGQQADGALTHETDPADHPPGHGSDHRDQRDAAVERAVPGDLRNGVPQDDVQGHQQHDGNDQRLEHGRRVTAPPTKNSVGEHPGVRDEPPSKRSPKSVPFVDAGPDGTASTGLQRVANPRMSATSSPP